MKLETGARFSGNRRLGIIEAFGLKTLRDTRAKNEDAFRWALWGEFTHSLEVDALHSQLLCRLHKLVSHKY